MAGAVSSVVNGPVTEVNFKAILTDAKPLGIGCHSNFGAVAGLVHVPYRPSAVRSCEGATVNLHLF